MQSAYAIFFTFLTPPEKTKIQIPIKYILPGFECLVELKVVIDSTSVMK